MFCGKAPGVRRRTTNIPTISSPRESGAISRGPIASAKNNLIGRRGGILSQIGDLDRLALREG